MPGLSEISIEGWITWGLASLGLFAVIVLIRLTRRRGHLWRSRHWVSAVFLSIIGGLLIAIGIDVVPSDEPINEELAAPPEILSRRL